MDRVELIEVDGATFRYQEELVSVYRNIADPFANQLVDLDYEPNPTDMTQLTKTIRFANELADGQCDAI